MTDVEFAGMLEGCRAWRMGPWRDRRERWDLLSIGDLCEGFGLPPEVGEELRGAGFRITQNLAKELLKPTRRRRVVTKHEGAIRAALKAAQDLAAPEFAAIEADVAEMRERWVDSQRRAS